VRRGTVLLGLSALLAASLSLGFAQEAEQCVGIVSLCWPGHDLSNAQVRVFRDAGRQDLVGAFPATSAAGSVVIAVPAGTYYLTAVADLDQNDKVTAGDGLGFSGVIDPTTDRPAAVEVKDKAFALWLPISLQMGADGKLSPTGVTKPEPPAATKMVALSGAVSGRGAAGFVVVYAVAKSGTGPCRAALPAADGTFKLQVPAGEYTLFAVQDANETEKVDAGDLMAVPAYQAAQGRAFPYATFTANAVDLSLALQWRLTPDGLLKSIASGAEGPQTAPETIPAVVFGRIVGSTAATTVRAAVDSHFLQYVDVAGSQDGQYLLALPAGTYFLSLLADTNTDGKPSPGDLVGFYGVSSLRLGHGPQPLLLGGGEMRPLDLAPCSRLDENLKPGALPQ
jgi:uncharacterized protein (DUF2141 family)